jgi:hypothetical protein
MPQVDQAAEVSRTRESVARSIKADVLWNFTFLFRSRKPEQVDQIAVVLVSTTHAAKSLSFQGFEFGYLFTPSRSLQWSHVRSITDGHAAALA